MVMRQQKEPATASEQSSQPMESETQSAEDIPPAEGEEEEIREEVLSERMDHGDLVIADGEGYEMDAVDDNLALSGHEEMAVD